MDRDKQIFMVMHYKTFYDRWLENAFREGVSVDQIMTAWNPREALQAASEAYESFDWNPSPETPQEVYGGPTYGVPVLNQTPPQAPAQTSTAPWGNAWPEVLPAQVRAESKWLDFCPFKGWSKFCPEFNTEWGKVTYRQILERVEPDYDQNGKPRYGTPWGTLAWGIDKTDPNDPQYGKANRYKVAQLKGVMETILRRRPPQGPPKEGQAPSQGRYVESPDETKAKLEASMAPAGYDPNSTEYPGETPF